ncbi:class I SAM-dependent methyltransferase [Kibdelosporangium lantanae]
MSLDVSPQQRADLLESVYMPISPEAGDLLYALVRATRPQTVVEYGTSYGISTLHLAAAVADNGVGHVYGSEMNATKIAAASANLAEAGLADHVTILPGDARETLAGVPGPVGFVLMDGWKELSLAVLETLEQLLTPGALVLADDTELPSLAGYLAYVRDPANGYTSVNFPVADGMEVSCRTA